MCTPEETDNHPEFTSDPGDNGVEVHTDQLSKTKATPADTVSRMRLATDEENDPLLEEFGEFLELLSTTLIDRYLDQVFAGYRLIEHIGSGASSVVFKAQSVHTPEKFAAVKIIYAVDGHAGAFTESSNLAVVEKDPRFVKLFNSGVGFDGHSLIIMDYLDADNVDEWATRQRRNISDIVTIVAEVAGALAFAHKSGIVHGDIKSSHIKVIRNSTVAILDLGVSVRGDSIDQRACTHRYASPQRINREPLSKADDVYSIGVLLAELLIGDQACHGITECHLPGHIPRDLQNIIRKCLATQVGTRDVAGRPDLRYTDAQSLHEDLKRFLKSLPVSASDNTFRYRVRRFLGRNRLSLTGFGFLGIVFAVVFIAFFTTLQNSNELIRRRLGDIVKINDLANPEGDRIKRDIIRDVQTFIKNLPFKSDRIELLHLMAEFESAKLEFAYVNPGISLDRLVEIRQNLNSLPSQLRDSRAGVAVRCSVLLQTADLLFESSPLSQELSGVLADARALLQSYDSRSVDVDFFPLRADILDRFARLRVVQQRLTEADTLYTEAESFRRRLPENRQRALRLAISLVHRADLRMAAGTDMTDRDKARRLFEEARAILDDAGNLPFSDVARAVVEERLGQMSLQDGSLDSAAGHFGTAEGLYRRLLEANPESADFKLRLAVILQFVGDPKFERGYSNLLADLHSGRVTETTVQLLRESHRVHTEALIILDSMPDAMRARRCVLEAKMELLKRLATSATPLGDAQGQRSFSDKAKQIAEELFTRNPQPREALQLTQAAELHATAFRGFDPNGVRESLEKSLHLLRLNGAGRGENIQLDECYARVQELFDEMNPKELSLP